MMRACTLILATVLHLAHSQTFPSPPPAPLPLAPGPAAILYNCKAPGSDCWAAV